MLGRSRGFALSYCLHKASTALTARLVDYSKPAVGWLHLDTLCTFNIIMRRCKKLVSRRWDNIVVRLLDFHGKYKEAEASFSFLFAYGFYLCFVRTLDSFNLTL